MSDTADGLQARIDNLMKADNATFVREAYQLILGRGLDAEGEAFYGHRLAAGAKRPELLQELAQSDEGRAQLMSAPAVADALARQFSAALSEPSSVAQWLRDPDHVFVQQAAHALLGQAPDAESSRLLLARLRGGLPRFRLLQDLAESSGRQRFDDIDGLDALLDAARGPLYPVAKRLDELYAFEDEAFVDCAYKTLLGRPPDFSGLAHSVDLLRQGQSKDSVILGLATSSEGRARAVLLPGLNSKLALFRWARIPLLGILVSWLFGVDSRSAGARHGRLQRSIAMRNHALEALLRNGSAGAGTGTGMIMGRVHAQSLKTLETALLARHEALVDIQRDSFDRELTALRKVVSRMQDEQAHGHRTATHSARLRARLRR